MDKEDAVYISTMEYYAAIKRNEILPFAMMWMELEDIVLSEVSQSVFLWQLSYDLSDTRNLRDRVGALMGREGKNETRWDQEGDKP